MRTIEEETKKINFPVNFQVLGTDDVDDTRFTKVKVWMLHLGMNEDKGIDFPKEVVDEAIPTLKNIPIVSKVIYNPIKREKDFSDHVPLVNKKGDITHGTKPIGVIPETNNPQYEKRLCDDLIERTFLTVEGLIWNSRAEEELDILKNTGVKGHSMELAPDMTEYKIDEDGILIPEKIGFNGACILGDHIKPSMQSSTIDLMFSAHDFSSEVQAKLTEYSEYFESKDKGGENMSEEKVMVCRECGTKRDKEKEEKCKCGETKMITQEEYDKKKEEKPEEKKEEKDTDYSATTGEEVQDEIEVEDKTEEVEEVEEVEEHVEEEVEAEKENGSGKAKMPSDYQALKQELEELKTFKAKIEKEEREKQEAALFAKYEPLAELEEFKALKEKAHEFSMENLERECALVFANNYENLEFSSNDKDIDGGEGDSTEYDFTQSIRSNKETKYGGLLDKHFGDKK